MPRLSTGNKTHVWRLEGAQETTSRAPRPESSDKRLRAPVRVHASSGNVRAQLDLVNRKRRAMRKQIADRTRALAELDAHAAQLERMLREAASHYGTTEDQ